MKNALLAAVMCAAMAGCGGGGGSDSSEAQVTVAWDKAQYVVTATATGGSANAVVSIQGKSLPPTVGVELSPKGVGTGAPSVGNGPWFMNSAGQVPVTITVPSTTAKGTYPLNASTTISGTTYTGTATLVVQ